MLNINKEQNPESLKSLCNWCKLRYSHKVKTLLIVRLQGFLRCGNESCVNLLVHNIVHLSHSEFNSLNMVLATQLEDSYKYNKLPNRLN